MKLVKWFSLITTANSSPVAQLVEQSAVNRPVVSSSLTRGAIWQIPPLLFGLFGCWGWFVKGDNGVGKISIIFDLDGTLIDSAPDIHFAANKLLKKMGHEEVNLPIIRSFIGNGIPVLIKKLMDYRQIEYSDELHKQLCADFRQYYLQSSYDNTRIYPNLLLALNELKEKNYKLGICTNKIYDLTKKIIFGLGLSDYFSSIIAGDSLPTHKPNPEMLFASINELGAQEAIFIGDSEVDAQTAKNANVKFILYTNGYRKSPVEELEFVEKFDDYSQLGKIIEKII